MTLATLHTEANEIAQIEAILVDSLQAIFHSHAPEDKIHRITIDIPSIDIINWFEKQDVEEKIFWSDRDSKFSVAGIHFADKIENGTDQQHPELFEKIHGQLITADDSVKYYGGIKFDTASKVSERWKKFSTAVFILPRFELLKRNDGYQFVCNVILPHDIQNQELILSQVSHLDFSLEIHEENTFQSYQRVDYPNREEWISRVQSSLDALNSDTYEKIVLARQTELTFQNELTPSSLMSKLLESTSNCFHFCFQLSKSNAFLGATPERLYYRKQDILKCEAVAGTRSRGDDERHDRSLGDELLRSKKDIREHKYVIDSILESLTNYIDKKEKPSVGDVLLVQLAKVQHLIKRFRFKLHDTTSDFDLVNSLHPTAAVGGYPKQNIFKEIAKLEQFDRGWYAAPIGWISKNTSEFAVAIRSGLIDNNRLTLYSGAGIIDGSIPESEWDEIENKISNYLKILES